MARHVNSYSPGRKRSITFNVVVSILAFTAIVVMANYLAARHYSRSLWSTKAKTQFSPLTRTILGSITNEVQVTVFFDKDEPLYDSVWALLKEYKFANPHILVDIVDYERDPGKAMTVKNKYKLNSPTAKNLIVFESGGSIKIVHESQLSELDVQSFTRGESEEVRRTHFRGELEFTSALLTVTSSRALKAYFLHGHGEHQFDNEDKLMGYSRFAGVLQENNIRYDRLSLLGTNDIPADCHLLIIAGPRTALLPEELDKINLYLKQGGRLLALFNYESIFKPTGLEQLLADWGVSVGRNVVFDQEHTITGQDMVVSNFGDHPLVKSLFEERLYLVLPRSVSALSSGGAGGDAMQIEVLAQTTQSGRIVTDVRPGFVSYKRPNDFIGEAPLMVAVEKGGIRGVSAERGTTRIVVVGESIFLGNETLPKLANRDFASHALNWLLARHELLVGLTPQPIKEYKVALTRGQMTTLRWLFLAGMPGTILLVGFLVHLRRKN